MSIDRDDPKLTAYALGELPQDEAAEVEAAVEKDPALKAEVESIRQVAEKLKTTLAAEPLPGGEGASEGETANKPARRLRLARGGPSRRWMFIGGSVVAIGLVCIAMLLPAVQTARESARRAASMAVDESASAESPERLAARAGCELHALEEGASRDLRYDHAPRADESVAVSKDAGREKEQLESFAILDAEAKREPVVVGKPAAGPATKRDEKTLAVPGQGLGTPVAEYNRSVGQPAGPAAGERAKQVRSLDGKESLAGLPAETKPANDVEHWLPPEQLGDRLALDPSIRRPSGRFNTETYDKIVENEFKRVSEHPLSTFSIDVDTASYSNVRRMLTNGQMPIPGAVRLEELINYFDYAYEPPTDDVPFATHVDAAKCPWNDKHNLVRIGLKGKVIAKEERDPANLVFLLDVSGSMRSPNKLGLLKTAMTKLVNNLNDRDRVAIAVYAGAAGLVLDSTPCSDRQKIIDALARLEAGGSTNGGAGIQLAYATAAANFIEGGVNRVILCTDGDFNIGMTNNSELITMIEKKAKAKEPVFLTVLGFGMGNYKDSRLEKLADKGNGNYGYIDTPGEADKMLVEGLSGTLVTIAKDVKIQVEFNPHHVKGYRLLGYENRMLKKEDFNDDTKDAGEIGAGHTVTALYELIPADSEEEVAAPKVDDLKYQKETEKTDAARSDELLTVKLRYKEPDGDKSKLLTFPVKNEVVEFDAANVDLKFASSVAAFGMLLRDSQYKGTADYDKVLAWAKSSLGEDQFNYREGFLKLIRAAKSLENK